MIKRTVKRNVIHTSQLYFPLMNSRCVSLLTWTPTQLSTLQEDSRNECCSIDFPTTIRKTSITYIQLFFSPPFLSCLTCLLLFTITQLMMICSLFFLQTWLRMFVLEKKSNHQKCHFQSKYLKSFFIVEKVNFFGFFRSRYSFMELTAAVSLLCFVHSINCVAMFVFYTNIELLHDTSLKCILL
jgi:hypothetical protein